MSGRSLEDDYRSSANMLASMVAEQRAHVAEKPNCGGAPMCLGMPAMMAYASAVRLDPALPGRLVLAAVGELREARDEISAIRGMLADAAAQLERSAAAAEEERNTMLGRIDDLEAANAELQAMVDDWDAAADVIGPVIEP